MRARIGENATSVSASTGIQEAPTAFGGGATHPLAPLTILSGVPSPRSAVHQLAASFGVSASAESNAFNIAVIVASVSSPMLEMRKVFPFSLP